MLTGPIERLTAELDEIEKRLLSQLNSAFFVEQPVLLFGLRIRLAEIVSEALELELGATGGEGLLVGSGRGLSAPLSRKRVYPGRHPEPRSAQNCHRRTRATVGGPRNRMITDPILRASDIVLGYPGDDHNVLDHFDLELKQGEVVSILGPSGIGQIKPATDPGRPSASHRRLSLRARHAAGRPASARCDCLSGSRPPAMALARAKRRLRPELQASTSLVAIGNAPAVSIPPSARSACRKRDASFRISSPAAWRSEPRLPRAWARKPDILLLDEPFGALDEVTRSQMQQLLLKIVRDFQTAAVLITHDIDEALLVSDPLFSYLADIPPA